eukprot:365389-Chlamydomonas_euryale.AAC.10
MVCGREKTIATEFVLRPTMVCRESRVPGFNKCGEGQAVKATDVWRAPVYESSPSSSPTKRNSGAVRKPMSKLCRRGFGTEGALESQFHIMCLDLASTSVEGSFEKNESPRPQARAAAWGTCGEGIMRPCGVGIVDSPLY